MFHKSPHSLSHLWKRTRTVQSSLSCFSLCVRYGTLCRDFLFTFDSSTYTFNLILVDSLFFCVCMYLSVLKHRQTKGNVIPSSCLWIFLEKYKHSSIFPAQLVTRFLHHAVAAYRPCGLVYVVLNRDRKAYSADYSIVLLY